jgi:adenosylmethionine-8-amino-7-oxononanoate aminotransferase
MGFIGELTTSSGAIGPPPPEYPGIIRKICNKYDMLMIVDEVFSAFGRTGETFFESEQYKITPDIIVMGKGLGGGHLPVSNVLVRSPIVETFFTKNPGAGFQHGFTMGSYAPGCAVGLAVIEELEEKNIINDVRRKGEYVAEAYNKLQKETSIVGDIRIKGLDLNVELVKNRETKEGFSDLEAVKGEIMAVGRTNGVILFVSHLRSVIFSSPALNITFEELDVLINAVEKAVKAVEARFLRRLS